jgi:HSP20 family molecular chaperone IbpA
MKTVLFDSPFLLGFDHTRALIERAAKAAAEGYPPYNVEDLGDRRVRITLAVAGFTPDQLSVSVEGRQLVITGEKTGEDKTYVHRGIAARGFTRAFVLDGGLEVQGATLDHGLLHVELIQPEGSEAVKRIPIRTAGETGR